MSKLISVHEKNFISAVIRDGELLLMTRNDSIWSNLPITSNQDHGEKWPLIAVGRFGLKKNLKIQDIK